MSDLEAVLNEQNTEMVTPPGETIEEGLDGEQSGSVETDSEEVSNDGSSESEQEAKDSDELPLPEEGEPEKKEKNNWFDKKLARKQREIEQQQHESALLKAELERVKSAPQQQYHPVDLDAPKREAFQDESSFVRAVIKHENTLEVKRQQEHSQQQAMMQAETSFRSKLNEALELGSDKYEDFEEVTKPLFSASFPPNRAMAEAIVDSEFKHDIFLFLGKYKDKALEIAKMNPVQAVKEIAAIEMRFKERSKSNSTKAPPPITPITGANGKSAVSNLSDLSRNSDKMSQRDFEATVKKMNAAAKKSVW